MSETTSSRLETFVRAWGPKVLGAAAKIPLPLATALAAPLLRKFRRQGSEPRPRSPDLFTDVAYWTRRNPEVVATVALGVGALLGPSRLRLVKAGLALLPRLLAPSAAKPG